MLFVNDGSTRIAINNFDPVFRMCFEIIFIFCVMHRQPVLNGVPVAGGKIFYFEKPW